MPEGDSVYLVARTLDRRLRGRCIVSSDFRTPKLATADVAGRQVLGHATHGKHLLTRLSGDLTLHSHLRMDGEWSITRPGRRLPSRLMPHVRLIWEIDSGVTVWGIRLHDLALVASTREHDVIGHLGPDPLREDWDAEEAVRRFRAAPDLPLVVALLDQTRMAGLGNLWANELAFLTGVSPWTPVGEVDAEALVARAARALRHSALVPNAYQVTTGRAVKGESHWVAGRQRRPCLRCGTTVQMVDEVQGDPTRRRTWWCPTCQPGPGRDD